MKKPELHIYVKNTATDEFMPLCPITHETVLSGVSVVMQVINNGKYESHSEYHNLNPVDFYDNALRCLQSARSLAKILDYRLVEHFGFWNDMAS